MTITQGALNLSKQGLPPLEMGIHSTEICSLCTYGWLAGGSHPNGMLSCLDMPLSILRPWPLNLASDPPSFTIYWSGLAT